MTEDEAGAVVRELKLLREQQWSMHRALVAEISTTNERLDKTRTELGERIDQTRTELRDEIRDTNERIGRLELHTVAGFSQVVDKTNGLQQAFERFVELVLDDRRRLWPEIDGIKSRLELLERKPG